MASTYAEARDALNLLAKTAWDAATGGAPLLYDNVDGERPAQPTTFGRVTVRFMSGQKASLGGTSGGRLFRREGLLYVQIFTPHGRGPGPADAIAQALVAAIEDPGATGNIWFRDVGAQEIGSDGGYWQVNVTARFQFDRIA